MAKAELVCEEPTVHLELTFEEAHSVYCTLVTADGDNNYVVFERLNTLGFRTSRDTTIYKMAEGRNAN